MAQDRKWDTKALLEKARRERHISVRPLPPRQPSVAGLGTLLVSAWAERRGRSALPKRDVLEAAMLAVQAPPTVQALLSVDRPSVAMSPRVAEYEEMLGWARQNGLASYQGWYVHAAEIDAMTARGLIEAWEHDWPDGVVWARQVVDAALA